MEGFNPTAGVAIKMFVDRSFGAVHQSLFLIQYMPGAKIDPHDHTFEESYLVVSGRVRATADGQTFERGIPVRARLATFGWDVVRQRLALPELL